MRLFQLYTSSRTSMRIFIQSPNINSPHGGIRVINEWANRLQDFGHRVVLYNQAGSVRCNLQPIKAKIVNTTELLRKSDCLIVTSPHGAFLLDKDVKKKFVFLQMLEHLFNPTNEKFFNNAIALYKTHYPIISISQWNIRVLQNQFHRRFPIHYVGNGVNLTDFPISHQPKDYKTILLESPEPTNHTKDTERLAIQVAKMLKERGYIIKGFGLKEPKDKIFDEFVVGPNLQTMNRLYEEATLLIKATKYDARSTAPLEAGTKGTLTIRGINEGDDDLNETNSFRTGYSVDKLYDATMFALQHRDELDKRANTIRSYVQIHNWDYWMEKINTIICQES
jgi:hypothetical protein